MNKKSIILGFGLFISTVILASVHAQTKVEVNPSKDAYFFVNFLPNEPATFLGGCAKTPSLLNNRTAYRGIDDPVLKRAIRNQLSKKEEFTAMNFVIDGKRRNAIILDKAFIKKHCQETGDDNPKFVVDVYQVDIQNDQDFSQKWVISKVYKDQ